MNATQFARFQRIRQHLPWRMKASFANSSGIFLGADYHFDLARPGFALYGGRPNAVAPNPMECPVRVEGRILQVRSLKAGETAGYGGHGLTPREERHATVASVYAAGFSHRLPSNRKRCM